MKVDPITLNTCSDCSWIAATSPNKSTDLFNKINGIDTVSNNSVFKYTSPKTYTNKDEVINDYQYVNMFLQYGNQTIKNLAMKIVNTSDSDDTKMEKIQRWVVNNLTYMEDQEQYGYSELWVPPTMTLKTMKGDCEDGSYLILSLGLNAGIDPNRLRFYGGVVKAGEGSQTGGHGWTAYKRESDDEWIPIDWCYYPDLRPMDDRPKLKNNEKYIDDYFMFEIGKVIITPDTNRVRSPEIYNNSGDIEPNIFSGMWLNTHV